MSLKLYTQLDTTELVQRLRRESKESEERFCTLAESPTLPHRPGGIIQMISAHCLICLMPARHCVDVRASEMAFSKYMLLRWKEKMKLKRKAAGLYTLMIRGKEW